MTKKLALVGVLLLGLWITSLQTTAQNFVFPYNFPAPTGPVEFNSQLLRQAGVSVAVTVNMIDGTSVIWEVATNSMIPLYPEQEIYEFYAVLGLLLKQNPELSELYKQSKFAADGSSYDGEYGVHTNALGIRRTTYTPQMMARLSSFQDVDNFGQIGGHTDIAILRRYFINELGQVASESSDPNRRLPNSHYTIHRVPQGTPDQSVLLREPDLARANDPHSPSRGALSWPALNRSSGCVNYDAATWIQLKVVLQPYLDEGKTVAVIFSVPGVNQDLLLGDEMSAYMVSDPFSNINIREWGYGNMRDRRGYYVPVAYREDS